jgi:hypothetical protein
MKRPESSVKALLEKSLGSDPTGCQTLFPELANFAPSSPLAVRDKVMTMELRNASGRLSPRELPGPKELASVLIHAVEKGTALALAESGALPAYLSKTEAYRLYGRTTVDRWIAERLIHVENPDGRNTKKLISRTALEAVAGKSNRRTYLPVGERRQVRRDGLHRMVL